MEVITCSWGAKRGSISQSFLGGKTVIKAGGKKITLPDDAVKTKITLAQDEMTAGRMLVIVLLAITVIGLILAIPLYFAGKKKRVNLAIKTRAGDTIMVAASNNNEAKLVQRFGDIGIFD